MAGWAKQKCEGLAPIGYGLGGRSGSCPATEPEVSRVAGRGSGSPRANARSRASRCAWLWIARLWIQTWIWVGVLSGGARKAPPWTGCRVPAGLMRYVSWSVLLAPTTPAYSFMRYHAPFVRGDSRMYEARSWCGFLPDRASWSTFTHCGGMSSRVCWYSVAEHGGGVRRAAQRAHCSAYESIVKVPPASLPAVRCTTCVSPAFAIRHVYV